MLRRVLVLDDDDDLRLLLGELLEQGFGLTAVLANGVKALLVLGPDALATELAILDINLGPRQPSGLEAFAWLLDHQYRGRIVFLTGHAAAHPLVERARELGAAQVLEKPVTFDRLARLIDESAP